MIQILCGKENYCIDKKIEKAKRQVTEMVDFNLSMYYDDYMVEDVISSVCASPLFSDVRVVILSLTNFKNAEELKRIADAVPSQTLFVLAIPSIDKRTAFYKAYQKDVVNCDKLDEETLQKFILQKAGEFGIRVKEDGVKELIDRTSYMELDAVNLYTVETVIKQLSLVKKDITVENVQMLLPPSSTGNAYALARFLCEKKNDELLKECRKILSALIGVDITCDECRVDSYMQWEKIDVVVEVVLQNGERHAVLIENKVKALLPKHELKDNKIKFKQYYDNDSDGLWHQHFWLIHAYEVPEYMKSQCDIDGYTYITLDELSHSSGPDLGNDIFDEFWRRKW